MALLVSRRWPPRSGSTYPRRGGGKRGTQAAGRPRSPPATLARPRRRTPAPDLRCPPPANHAARQPLTLRHGGPPPAKRPGSAPTVDLPSGAIARVIAVPGVCGAPPCVQQDHESWIYARRSNDARPGNTASPGRQPRSTTALAAERVRCRQRLLPALALPAPTRSQRPAPGTRRSAPVPPVLPTQLRVPAIGLRLDGG